MTKQRSDTAQGPKPAATVQPSTSVADPLTPGQIASPLRVKQAEFARMCNVSRQTVSQWVRKGRIKSLYPDGTFCPHTAAREILRYTPAGAMRARLFRVASEDAAALRQRIAQLEGELAQANQAMHEWHAFFARFKAELVAYRVAICAAGPAAFALHLEDAENAAFDPPEQPGTGPAP